MFGVIDAGRTSAAGALDAGINWSKKQLAQNVGKKATSSKSNKTAGAATTTPDTSTASIFATLWTVVATVSLFVLSALRYLVGNAGMFYPFLLIVFFYILWRIFRGIRRPSY